MARLAQLHEVDLKLLRYFCAIVEENSFTAAQAKLNISQSSLSEYLKSLEVRLGLTLCQRGPKGFVLYEEGRQVYQAAQVLFESIDRFKDKVFDIGEAVAGELNIIIQDGIINNPRSKIPLAIQNFTSKFPLVKLKVELMLGNQMITKLSEGFLGVGIGLPNHRVDNLNYTELFDEVLNLYCAKGHPAFEVVGRDFDEQLIAKYPYCSRGNLEVLRTGRGEKVIDVGLGGDAQLALILSGRDLGYLSEHTANPYVAMGQMKRIDTVTSRQVVQAAAAVNSNHLDHRVLREFVKSLIEVHSTDMAIGDSPAGISKRSFSSSLSKQRIAQGGSPS